MGHDPASVARQLYDNWNKRDFDASAAMTADDCVVTIAGSGEQFHGPDGAIEFGRRWADAFPDGRITIDNVIAASDHAVVQFRGSGTHTGTLRTPMGDIPATGKHVELRCVLEQLERGRPLAGHDQRVVVRLHELEPAFRREPCADLLAILAPAVVRHDLGAVAARRLELRLCDVHRIADGKIQASTSYFDAAAMMAQLGLMPVPAAAKA